ncbi:ATP-dependent DNA helicase [Trichonephila clavata]|uniref:ATP-dependent DNA helicase n=1 Tax=Trichonephila clavata TaxID=2740835 RepID=A0A8X6L4W7_TRICU|nr:ATP-dependent DNA helicase [Trichonephila clavata]
MVPLHIAYAPDITYAPDLQAHNFILKVGAPIMLIRNIDAPRLCNGTRLIVRKLMQHVIQATVLTGCAKGEDVFIPRIPIIPSDSTAQFKRIQFLLKLCFAITINKSQGQSLGIAGIDLKIPCFSHG